MKKSGVYILQSVKNSTYYIGSTDDFSRRIFQHDKGLVSATKNLLPMVAKVFLPCESISEARRAERRLKSYKRRDILERVIIDKTFPWNYRRL